MIKTLKQYTEIFYDNINRYVKRFSIADLSDYLYSFYNDSDYRIKFKDNYVSYEYFNPKLIKWILKNENKVKKILNDKNNKSNYIFNVLDVLNKTNIKGFVQTIYNKNYCGRYYAVNNISLQNMWKQIRQILSYGLYYDVDVVNCHPRILASICELNNIQCPSIIEYRDNRDKHMKDLMKLNNQTRDEIKKMIISILNGGTKDYKKCKKTPFLIKLFNEYEKIVELIVNKNINIYNKCLKNNKDKNERNKIYNQNNNNKRDVLNNDQLKIKSKRTTISYFLMTKENEILQYMIKYFKDNKLITNDLYICIFDGFQFNQSNHSKGYINIHLRKLEDNIERDLKIDIKLKIKDFDNCKEFLKIIPKKLIKKSIPINLLKHLIKSNQFNKKRVNYKISNLEEIDADIIYNNNKIDGKYRIPSFEKEIEDNDTINIKSNMGTGKTFQLYKYIKKIMKKPLINYSYIKKPKICFIGFRKTLGMKYMKDLNGKFEYYLDILKDEKKIDSEQHPYLIIQINSLYKIIGSYDIIVLDEVSYTFDTFLSFCDERQRVYKTLHELADDADKVITMDAYLSKRDIDFINKLRPDRKVCTILNKSDDCKGFIDFYDKKTFIDNIIKKLQNKKKIVLASNSLSFLEKTLEGILKVHNIKYLFITSESEFINNCDNWSDYQFVAYTPTITAGVSFEKDHFDYKFGYFSNMSACASICCQQLFRVRTTVDKNLHIYINKQGKNNYPSTKIKIIKYLNDYLNLEFEFDLNLKIQDIINKLLNEGMISLNKGRRSYKENDYFKLLIGFLDKVFKSANNLDSELLYYLKIQGYRLRNTNINDENARNFDDIIDDYKDIKMVSDANLYKNEKCPNTKEYKKIKDKERKSKIDKVKVHLYELKELNINISNKQPKEIRKIINNLQNIRFDFYVRKEKSIYIDLTTSEYIKKNIIQRLDDKNEIIDTDFSNYAFDMFCEDYYKDEYNSGTFDEDFIDSHKQLSRDYWLKCLSSSELFKIMGFKNCDDFNTIIQLNNDTRIKIFNYITKKWLIFDHLFKCDSKWENKNSYFDGRLMSFLNPKLNLLNRELKTKQLRNMNGKKYYVYSIKKKVNF